MNRIGFALLSIFAGWTLACHISTLAHFSLLEAALLAPVLAAVALIFARGSQSRPNITDAPAGLTNVQAGLARPIPALVALGSTALMILALHYSWQLFWVGSVVIFGACLLICGASGPQQPYSSSSHISRLWIGLLGAFAVCLALTATRSDLDDAYYVAVAAFAHAHPHEPLLQNDPMFGNKGLPLLFPSYRFTTYEPLGALIAWLLGIPAMDVMYRILPPFSALATVASVFFCSRELNPRRWLVTGSLAIALLLLLGENHRSLGNFGFVRIFQGKAVFVSALVPLIYGLSFRYASSKGKPGDLLLLVYAQLAAIGLSNFAILGAPMAALVAAVSAAPPLNKESLKKLLRLAATCCITLPYLAWVALQSHDAQALSTFDYESAQGVWLNVFGQVQQYFIAVPLLLAPWLVQDSVLRWRLAAPCLIMLAILLNPLLAPLISRYVTSPPVYFRVTWCLPITIYLATAICAISEKILASVHDADRSFAAITFAAITTMALLALTCLALPYNVARPENHVSWQFAGRKVNKNDLAVATRAIQLNPTGLLLAPDEIAGVTSMYEEHPPLVNVRSFYIDMLKSQMPLVEYQNRKTLASWVSGNDNDAGYPDKALKALGVETVVTDTTLPHYVAIAQLLAKNDFVSADSNGSYVIWAKMQPAHHLTH